MENSQAGTLKNRSRSPMLEPDLDLIEINVHTQFGDPRSFSSRVIVWKLLTYNDLHKPT
jgi:hypothetical protein